ncbi:restriction endonuclease subunit S [Campylobacter upsaliensis]|uniref:restriction endonuclease subunit S n=1 Tax=Campylobacter upsaliensis TaxID=28080 RepID=UPI0022EA4AD3|nr:restriction endonuclease subunit S [Campylobacter upsaliensis]MEB2802434.1 restriction endonuclease subunit S [Campylobacter upsaliensis]MEB2824739.1 restriction endonuclease subunit S [Campylobacter upsaliensis]
MKTDTLKKSLLDYAIKGKLTAKFRRENSELSAFDELEIYNDKIKQKRKNLEKELKTLEFKLKKASTRHCETSAGSRGKTSEAVQGVAEAGFFSNPQTKQELKSQIQMLKKELTKCKEITPLNLSEAPFEIPNSWAWVKLGDICEIVSGGTPSRDKIEYWHNGTIPWVKIADVKNNVVNQTQEFITELGLENSSAKIFKKGTLLYTIFATLGETAILNIDAATNQAIAALIEAYDYDTKFLMYCLMSMKDYVNSLGRGVAQNNINQTMLKNFTIPLPPLCEQQEIVKKLDLLVSLANDFAITKENLKRIEKRIEKSLLKLALEGSLSKLYRRSSPTLSAFDEINTYNEAIKEKRKNLEKELKKCEKEFKLEKDKDKKALCKSQIQMLKKELTKCKEIVPLNLSEAPFTIPNSWAWVKLGDICEMKKGPFGSAITKDMFIPNGSNAVKIYEQKNAIQKSETLGEYYISLEHFEKLKQFEVFENDIIVSCAGTIGEIFRIPKNAPKGIINQALMKIKLVNEEWIPYFMIFFDFLIKQKSQENSKGSAIKNIPPLDILKNFTIPLPPLQEQEHITQILDTLFTLKKGLRVD